MLTFMVVTEDTSADELSNMQNRYRLRRALANLSNYPEGYEIVLPIGGQQNEIVILSPPDVVAVQRADGTWYRRPRNVTQDGPMPYTFDWYQHYLEANNLPTFFLRPEHYSMLEGNAEAEALGIADRLAALTTPNPDWMRRRYPRPVRYLLPDAPNPSSTATPIDLKVSQQEGLGLRFPATTASADLFNDYRVYVLPNGHVTIRYNRGSVVDAIDHDSLRSVLETRSSYLASYVIEGRTRGLTAGSTRDRAQERGEAENAGGIVDWDEQPNGIGRWEWLNRHIDAEIAVQYGINTPEDVMRARENGVLTNVPYAHRPLTVWRPHLPFLNPDAQPAGQGRWEYTTTPSRDLAYTNLGGQEGFEDIPYPTAAQVFDRRRQIRDEIARGDRGTDTDNTANVDLVWVPTTPPANIIIQPPQEPTLPDEDGLIDPVTGLAHQPKNDGKCDQTGEEGQRAWQTIKINGRIFTLDRSRAHADRIQEWKSWSLTPKGFWVQWNKYKTLDWTNPDEVEKMNKWREQSSRRVGFYAKRKDNRPGYTQPERAWLFEFVKAAEGDRPSTPIADIMRRFNQRFERQRKEVAIQSVIDRLRKEYKENNGSQRPKQDRRRRSSTKPNREVSDDEKSDMEDGEEDYGEDEE